jgi:glyoxylase-like metal-dependent hydrolase (beta-lactamase superfamily II)
MIKNFVIYIILFLSCYSILIPSTSIACPNEPEKLIFVVAVSNASEVRSVEFLLKSLREFGGKYKRSRFYVVYDKNADTSKDILLKYDVEFVPLQMDSLAVGYLFSKKVYACAQVEKLIALKDCSLVWLDNECLIFSQPDELELKANKQVAMRPVFLLNNVGQTPESPVDNYWKRIYQEANVEVSEVPVIESFVESKQIRFYINCQVISVNPKLGIFSEWERIFTRLVHDKNYQEENCADLKHQIFLHQSVLSAVICSKTNPEQLQWFSNSYAYPIQQHDRLPVYKKIEQIDNAKILVYEKFFIDRPNWIEEYKISKTLRNWLKRNYSNTFKVSDNIYRYENSCNSYLVLTKNGNVIIDPGGADNPGNWLERINGRTPVRAVLITHGHQDHTSGISLWATNKNIPVIANRKIIDFINYQDMFSKFTAIRTAKQRGLPIPTESPDKVERKLEINKLFDDEYTMAIGGLTFKMIHVGGETPDNSLIWIPKLKALFIADNFYTSFPNLYTLRGTMPRWALEYINSLEIAINLNPEILLPGHGEPIIGNSHVISLLKNYRDAIRYVHDATVVGMNDGKDLFTLMKEITLPEKYRSTMNEYYGRVSWSVRGIYEGYVGWFDENPASMYNEPISIIYNDILKLTHGTEAINEMSTELLRKNEFIKVLRLTEIVLFNDPLNKTAAQIRYNALQKLKFQCQNYIEFNWLNHSINQCRQILSQQN